MKIAFLQETVNQNIGIMYLSSLLKSAGHSCELFVEPLENNFIASVRSFNPDITGFSVITGSHHWALETASEIKKMLPATYVILGGPHPTYFPEIINNDPIDAIARGEAELSFPEWVAKISEGKDYSAVPGIWSKKKDDIYRNDVAALVDDISSLPFPDHSLYLKYSFYKNQREVPFSTTRGCPFKCSFCYNHTKTALYKGKGNFVRMRNIDNIIGEMKMAKGLYPNMRSVILYDDIIGLNKKWLVDFTDAYAKEINLPWFTSIRADLVDEPLVKQLSRANCFCLSVGVETGNEALRDMVLCKRIPNSQYIKAADLIRGSGIKLRTSNMFFLPGEDIDKALETVDLNRAMKVDFAWVYTMQPYPGTEIYEYAVKNGYIASSFNFDDIDPLGLVKPIVQLRDQKKILVLHRLFQFTVHYRLVRKLIRLLLVFPPNPLFDGLYYFSLIQSYSKYHQVSLWRSLQVAWTNFWGTGRRHNKKKDV